MKNYLKSLVPVVVVVATLSSGFLMPGCSGVTFQSGDALKGIYSAQVATLKAKYGSQGSLSAELQTIDSGAKRNQVLNDFIFLIDNNYVFWEKNLYNKKAFSDFGTDVATTTLSTLSGIVTGGGVQGAKSILAFVAGGITSSKASFNADILQSQNLLAIVSRMRAQRAEKRVVLQKGMYAPGGTTASALGDYSMNQGLIDLAAYYEAGTFVSALQDIIDKAGKDKAKSDDKVQELKGIPD